MCPCFRLGTGLCQRGTVDILLRPPKNSLPLPSPPLPSRNPVIACNKYNSRKWRGRLREHETTVATKPQQERRAAWAPNVFESLVVRVSLSLARNLSSRNIGRKTKRCAASKPPSLAGAWSLVSPSPSKRTIIRVGYRNRRPNANSTRQDKTLTWRLVVVTF